MNRDEFEFHMNLARKGLPVGIFLFICAVLMMIVGHASVKGYIFGGLWLALIGYGIYHAVNTLRIGKHMEATGQVHDNDTRI